jgi:guanylate kinase
MGKLFCLMGKSSSGKDTIYKKLLEEEKLHLERIVPYTTRPIRIGEQEGREYHFVTQQQLEQLKEENRVIECRSYHTACGIWSYFTVCEEHMDLKNRSYLMIGTLEAYISLKNYFGEDNVCPLYIEVDDGERLRRALHREQKQQEPKYEELCRRFLADSEDFSEENLKKAGITTRYENMDIEQCIQKIVQTCLDICG